MTQMKLHLKLEHDASILSDFYSGIDAMDTFIHTRLSAFLRAYNCRFYVLRNEQGIVIAMFVTSGGQLYLDEDCKDDLRLKFPDIEERPELKDYWEAGWRCVKNIEINILVRILFQLSTLLKMMIITITRYSYLLMPTAQMNIQLSNFMRNAISGLPSLWGNTLMH